MSTELDTLKDTEEAMLKKLDGLLPSFEIKAKAELVYQINKLKKEKGAVILGHNYMEPALYHFVTDIVGDSLQLSKSAAETDADTIIFCGVRFMAETAKILSPEKTVLLPAKVAGCSLAESITAEDVRQLRKDYPGVPIVAYVNTYADVKAEVDICCTSSNAAKIVKDLDNDTVIFLPDEYLAKNVAEETGKNIIIASSENPKPSENKDDFAVIGWAGKCEVHDRFTVEDVQAVRKQYPDVQVVAHPECPPEVVHEADFTGSTSKMIEKVKTSSAEKFLLLTECSMGDNIMAENPDKEILRMCSFRCPHMNEITLEDTLKSLTDGVQVIEVPEEISKKAKKSLDRMLDYL